MFLGIDLTTLVKENLARPGVSCEKFYEKVKWKTNSTGSNRDVPCSTYAKFSEKLNISNKLYKYHSFFRKFYVSTKLMIPYPSCKNFAKSTLNSITFSAQKMVNHVNYLAANAAKLLSRV